jgi:hypothetical protein
MSEWNAKDPRIATIWEICGETAALLDYTAGQGQRN